jgi:hypothetical protein
MNEFNQCIDSNCVCTQEDLSTTADPWLATTRVLYCILLVLIFAPIAVAVLA